MAARKPASRRPAAAASAPRATAAGAAKRPFDIPEMLRRIRRAVEPFPRAALFELHDDYPSPWQILVGCLLSIRTLDEVSLPAARRLLARAPNPGDLADLSADAIDALIRPCTFHEAKAPQLRVLARDVVGRFGGELPCDLATLLTLKGVGPKCAALTLGIACGQAHIAVDIHVHRVTNRWGYVSAPTPEKTQKALEEKLPREHWVELNALLVPFGKHICTGPRPRCSTCPVLEFCRQVGVRRAD